MSEPPEGEAELRALADEFMRAEGHTLAMLAEAAAGQRRWATRQALERLAALRLLDLKGPVIAAYLHEHPRGSPDAVKDLAGALALRLDRGAQTVADGIRQMFSTITSDTIADRHMDAVTAAVDRRGGRWPLGQWAETHTTTYGRHATSRGLADRVGKGGVVTISTGECGWCKDHSGDAVIGQDPLPPYHPSCSCTATAA